MTSTSTAAPAPRHRPLPRRVQPGVWAHPGIPGRAGVRNSIAQRWGHCTGSLQYTWSSPRGRALPPPTAPRDPLVTRSLQASRQRRPGSSAAPEGFLLRKPRREKLKLLLFYRPESLSRHDSIEFAGNCEIAQRSFTGTESVGTLLGSSLSGFVLSYSYAPSIMQRTGGNLRVDGSISLCVPFVKCVKWW